MVDALVPAVDLADIADGRGPLGTQGCDEHRHARADVGTLEPLAVDRRLQLEVADELAEGAPIGAALELMLSVSSEGPAAFCTHADVMMDSIEELLAAGVPLDGPLEFKKAATWILETRDRSFAGGRYLPPPGGRVD